jgi:hypothetical protein
MNVALTRARYNCWVVGHRPTLASSSHWAAFMAHADAAGSTLDVPAGGTDPLTLGGAGAAQGV